MGGFFMQARTIETTRFLLTPVLLSDQDIIFAGLSDPQVIQYYGVSYTGFAETSAQMEFYARHQKNDTGEFWMVSDKKSGERLGVFGAYNFSSDHRKLEIGYWLLPRFWRKGVAREVFPAFLKKIQEIFPVHRIEAWVETGNEASIHLLESAEFKREGLLMDAEIKNGNYISLIIYALLV